MNIFICKCILIVILMVKIIHCEDNSCNVKIYPENNDKYFADIKVPVPDNHNNNIKLSVRLAMANAVLSNKDIDDKLHFAGNADDVLNKRPLIFKLEFPAWNNDLQPRIIRISINDRPLCFGKSFERGAYSISTVELSSTITLTTSASDNFYTKSPVSNPIPINPQFTNVNSNNRNRYSTTSKPFIPNYQKSNVNRIPTTPRNNIGNNFESCGRTMADKLIARGEDAKMGAHPWIGALFLAKSLSNPEYLCGASLISNKLALTAAHCVAGQSQSILYVAFGRIGVNDWLDENSVQVKVQKSEIHPDYSDQTSDADIAILRFTKELTFTSTVQPVCLWEIDSSLRNIVNQTGVVVGWGKNEKYEMSPNLQEVYLRVVSEEICLRSADGYADITSSRTFCAGNGDSSGPCSGDSGSGFYFFINGKWIIRGIVSRSLLNSSGRCDFSKYAIYLDVAKYIQWIHTFL